MLPVPTPQPGLRAPFGCATAVGSLARQHGGGCAAEAPSATALVQPMPTQPAVPVSATAAAAERKWSLWSGPRPDSFYSKVAHEHATGDKLV